MADIPADTILIHGERRHHPLIDVLDWLRPQDIPVIVIPAPTTSSTASSATSRAGSRSCDPPALNRG
jgi:hypothetical protein